jgi:hypothetical protein
MVSAGFPNANAFSRKQARCIGGLTFGAPRGKEVVDRLVCQKPIPLVPMMR